MTGKIEIIMDDGGSVDAEQVEAVHDVPEPFSMRLLNDRLAKCARPAVAFWARKPGNWSPGFIITLQAVGFTTLGFVIGILVLF